MKVKSIKRNLLDWLSLREAAQELSREFSDDFGTADVLRLIHAGRLSASVVFDRIESMRQVLDPDNDRLNNWLDAAFHLQAIAAADGDPCIANAAPFLASKRELLKGVFSLPFIANQCDLILDLWRQENGEPKQRQRWGCIFLRNVVGLWIIQDQRPDGDWLQPQNALEPGRLVITSEELSRFIAQVRSGGAVARTLRDDGERRVPALLRIIRALADLNRLKEREATGAVLAELQRQGFTSPEESAVRAALKDARALKP